MYHSAARSMMNACSKPALSLSQRCFGLWNKSHIWAWVGLSGSVCLIGLFLPCDAMHACMAHLLIGLLDRWMIKENIAKKCTDDGRIWSLSDQRMIYLRGSSGQVG
jgi:hypothetical protein